MQDVNPAPKAAGESLCLGRAMAQGPPQTHYSPHKPVQGKQERKQAKGTAPCSTAVRGGAEVTRDVSSKVTCCILQHMGFYQGSFLSEFFPWSDGMMAAELKGTGRRAHAHGMCECCTPFAQQPCLPLQKREALLLLCGSSTSSKSCFLAP